jgi:hypothetical protein
MNGGDSAPVVTILHNFREHAQEKERRGMMNADYVGDPFVTECTLRLKTSPQTTAAGCMNAAYSAPVVTILRFSTVIKSLYDGGGGGGGMMNASYSAPIFMY